jgi:hypothetical protein
MIEIYDDFHFINKACSYLKLAPFDRLSSVALTCFFNQDADFVRIASLLLIIISSYFIGKIFFEKDKKQIMFFIGLNSIALLPFYYATLISMSFVFLWSSIGLCFLSRNFDVKVKSSLVFFLWGAIGATVRSELLLYFAIFVGAWALFLQLKSKLSNPFKILSKNHYYQILIITLGFILGKLFLENMLVETMPTGESREALYPYSTFVIVQIWSAILYIRNTLFPFSFTFHGNFNDWFVIHQSLIYQLSLIIFAVTLLTYSFFRFFINKKDKKSDFFIAGIFVSFFSSFLLSIYPPSTDWYYLTRGYVGNVLLLVFIFEVIKGHKIILHGLIVMFLLSSVFHMTYHFSSLEEFYNYEKKFTTNAHPYIYELYAQDLQMNKNYEESLGVLREGYKTIPMESFHLSNRAYYYWLRNVYKGFIVGKKMNNLDVIKKSYELLHANSNTYALFACLQIHLNYKECDYLLEWKDIVCQVARGEYLQFDQEVFFTPGVVGFVKQYCGKIRNGKLLK